MGDGNSLTSATASLASAREDYTRGGLVEADAPADPLALFERWYAEARDAGLHEPNAMVVATATADAVPSSRIVLLKGFSADGFVFYTNTLSRKGRELSANPRVALLFPWHPLERQVRVDGTASLLPRAAVADYFAVRPRGSQVGAWASHQSTVVAGREALSASYDEARARFDGEDVPPPEEWGGYLVRPDALEFWQGRPGRMHDRLAYRRTDDGTGETIEGWRIERLAP